MVAPLSHKLQNLHAEYGKELSTNSAFFVKAKSGELTRMQLGLYFYNLFILLSQTEKNMTQAKNGSVEQNLSSLTEVLSKKSTSEKGNEIWALNDIKAFDFSNQDLNKFFISKNINKLISYLDVLAIKRPASYLVYHYLFSKLALDLGPGLLKMLHVNCGISLTQIQILEKYQFMDNKYNSTNFRVLDDILNSDNISGVKRDVFEVGILFKNFLQEMGNSYSGASKDLNTTQEAHPHI
jgi:hypothetical protein